VLTGARQTGKSTLARAAFSDYPVIDLDSPVEREVYERLGPSEWIDRYPRAIIDEAQKLPAVFETVKACYDRDPDVRYLLLGSSQILLLGGVRETLAGRVARAELYPFTLPELATDGAPDEPGRSLLIDLLEADRPAEALADLVAPDHSLDPGFATARRCFEDYLVFGGMPAVHSPGWSDRDRFDWLRDYHATYLQRDLADLARIDRLEPFVRAQRAAALRAGMPVNFSELARLADVSPPTAKQFMRYLEISYQVAWLPAWFRNPEKRLAKQPKLHFVDPGIRRAVLGKRGEADGAEFEGAIVAEVFKQCRTARLPVELHHLRTVDGREVDLLVEREDGFLAFECKQTRRVAPADFRHLRRLEELLDKRLLLGLVVSNDTLTLRVSDAEPELWNLSAPALLGAP